MKDTPTLGETIAVRVVELQEQRGLSFLPALGEVFREIGTVWRGVMKDPRVQPLQLGWHVVPPEVEVRCVHCGRLVDVGEEVFGSFDGTFCADCQRIVLGWGRNDSPA